MREKETKVTRWGRRGRERPKKEGNELKKYVKSVS